jgi:6-phosphogluconolactonase (cycloisomerase 2 family)
MLIHVGTCSFGDAATSAVLLLSLDEVTGALTLVGQQLLSRENPGWILHTGPGVAYVAYENADGAVQKFEVECSGALKELEEVAAAPTYGAHPCYLAKMGDYILCANYSDGASSLVALPLALHPAPPPALRLKLPGGERRSSLSSTAPPTLSPRRLNTSSSARPPRMRALPLLHPSPHRKPLRRV